MRLNLLFLFFLTLVLSDVALAKGAKRPAPRKGVGKNHHLAKVEEVEEEEDMDSVSNGGDEWCCSTGIRG
ncbi:hypothetical protein L5515_010765 [Caenorhabditis briggsae]|uniref:Uncharacterized protein n=1 Tax=Caenorhabditis briggsae TaxID=6238 RepID=A0AAE9ET09_CAEBR|nr:hypothetical protein L5515_010765 [Caenorhabditis briggsae]